MEKPSVSLEEDVPLEEQNIEEPLPELNTEDLDLLLYENPNFLS